MSAGWRPKASTVKHTRQRWLARGIRLTWKQARAYATLIVAHWRHVPDKEWRRAAATWKQATS